MHQETCSVDAVIDRIFIENRDHGEKEQLYSSNEAADLLQIVFGKGLHIVNKFNAKYVEDRWLTIGKYQEKLTALRKLEKVEQRSAEWFQLRKNIITASDFAQALGDGKFGSRRQIFQKKCGYEEDKFNPNIASLKWGTMFEHCATQIYERRLGCKVYEFGILKHPTITHFGASPDGINELGIMVEIKCPSSREITGEYPLQYYYQMQGQLDVCDLDECDFAEFKFEETAEIMDDTYTEQGAIIERMDNATGKYEYKYSDTYPYVSRSAIEDFVSKQTGCVGQPGVDVKVVNVGNVGNVGNVSRPVNNAVVRYWKLAKMNVQRVYRNKEFLAEKFMALEDTWKLVQSYTADKALYDKEVGAVGTRKSSSKKEKEELIPVGYAFTD